MSAEIAHIKTLITQSQLDEAIEALANLEEKKFSQEVLDAITGRWESLKESKLLGIIEESPYRTQVNDIRISLLQLGKAQENGSHEEKPPGQVIVGLRAYKQKDAEVFKHLQRGEEIKNFSDAILQNHFQFGVLMGVSGSGKTSFLRAGLMPELEHKKARVFYIKFSNHAPLETIVDPIKTSIRFADSHSLLQTITAIRAQVKEEDIVLIFDQFEQFFSTFKVKEDRKAFVQDLKDWYDNFPSHKVKILISIRSDLYHYLYEIEELLQCPFKPLVNYFNLNKFTALQATEIFKFIAKQREVPFEENFIQGMCEEELADEEGLISAVEIQILSMMLEKQKTIDGFAFTEKAYGKFGGIEGLLQRYLKEQLEPKTLYNKNQVGMKVLLALTDLDRNVRAGQLSLSDLKDKLKGILDGNRIPQILSWLEEARLITKIESEGKDSTYELAHERMIIPLRRLAGKTLSEIDQLSHLLDRRVNEWLGSGRKSRYLFSISELWKIRKFQKLISWEPKNVQKKELYQSSTKRLRNASIVLASLLLPIFCIYLFLQSPMGKESLIRNYSFAKLSLKANSESVKKAASVLASTNVALALPLTEKLERASDKFKILISINDSLRTDSLREAKLIKEVYQSAFSHTDSISSVSTKRDALLKLATKVADYAKEQKDAAYLEEGLSISKNIESASSRAEALRLLAKTAAEIDQDKKALAFLEEGLSISKNIEYANSRAEALRLLAKTAAEIAKEQKDMAFLEEGLSISKNIESAYYRAEALSLLAKTAAEIAKEQKDMAFLEEGLSISKNIESASSRASALRLLAKTAAEIDQDKKALAFLEEGLSISKNIEFASSRAEALSLLAKTAAEIDQDKKALAFLEEGLSISKNIASAYSRASALRLLAKTAAEIAKEQKDMAFLEEGLSISKNIASAYSRAEALSLLAKTAAEIDQDKKALAFLEEGLSISKNIEFASSRASALRLLAKTAAEIAKEQKDMAFLEEGLSISKNIESAFSRASALRLLAKTAAEIDQDKKALAFLEEGLSISKNIESASSRASALSLLAKTAAEIDQDKKALAFLQEGLSISKNIEDAYSRASALSLLAKTAAEIDQDKKALAFLEEGLSISKNIESASSRASALSLLAKTAAEIAKEQKDMAFLEEGLSISKNIESASSRAEALSLLAKAAAEIAKEQKDLTFLEEGLSISTNIESASSRASAFLHLIKAAADLEEWNRAFTYAELMPEEYRIQGYAWILRLREEERRARKPE